MVTGAKAPTGLVARPWAPCCGEESRPGSAHSAPTATTQNAKRTATAICSRCLRPALVYVMALPTVPAEAEHMAQPMTRCRVVMTLRPRSPAMANAARVRRALSQTGFTAAYLATSSPLSALGDRLHTTGRLLCWIVGAGPPRLRRSSRRAFAKCCIGGGRRLIRRRQPRPAATSGRLRLRPPQLL